MKVTKESASFVGELPATGLVEYLKSFNGCVDYGYIVDNDCILPFIKRKRLIFYYIQLPTPVLGAKDIDEEKIFLEEALEFIKKNIRADFISTTNTGIFNSYPNGSMYCKFGSYILDLRKTEDELFTLLHSKHRNVIRKAQKDGLLVFSGKEYLGDCYNLINETFSRQGLIAPTYEYVQQLSCLNENVFFSIVKAGNEIQGSAIFIWNKNHSCFYLHGGSTEHPHSGAMNLLHWETILQMKKNGVKFYDFVGGRINPKEGSRLEGIQRFKSRFGGDFEIGYLWKYPFSNIKYKIYSFLLTIYFKYYKGENYEGDVIDQEQKAGN
ncbi:MAG: peptidoglycan bridge formation glycyltransferase FemA/FemB family protein [Bacteroidales bacterium]|nr:peptidoglycan bridge formation glycyltransferase FemA/FemB family protein [Bacteroidales bacterium]